MNENKIQLGELLANKGREFHFALLGKTEQTWIYCFRKVCKEDISFVPLNGEGIKYPSNPSEFNQYSVEVVGESESKLRTHLEKAISRTNGIQNDPMVVEYWRLQREISHEHGYCKEILEKRLKEVETKLKEAGKHKYVADTNSASVELATA